MPAPFKNEPFTDFARPENREAFGNVLAQVKSELGKTYDIVIGDEHIKSSKNIKSTNPCNHAEVVGVFHSAEPALADKALETAWKAFETWQHVPAEKRAEIGLRAAALLRQRKHYFSAWMVHEVGKSWAEADGDTAEAIDFLEFYSREAVRYAQSQPVTPYPGEKNELFYIPLGAGVVIPPWNFPLAIAAGMSSAAFLAGNCVVLKPASDAPTIAYKFYELMREAGLPAGVLNFVPGSGSGIGNALIEHPRTRFVAFTGSMEVGLDINQKAAVPRKGQLWIKRVIAEMGGKDSIVVCADSDLDAAAEAISASAFGFQGQKCSACSRAIVEESVYDQVVAKTAERSKKIQMGNTTDPAVNFGAVINKGAFESITRYIETGKKEGKLVLGGESDASKGYFVQPTIIKDIDPMAVISQEEIFGPVLAFIKARNYDHALQIANNTQFGLTGSVFTRDEVKLARARRDFFVGNLYFNRKCTGALVDVHPFGGFNMSGTDSKAGGRDYLLLFLQAKSVSRKV